ncbi:ABC transporter ATP-binding protein [Brevibacillus choshinensis]|uniref:ABC transporter ATP-binding protein n=1 Tax=Brevibacillus choshinensis TaxID=54911 RepID=UPI000AC1CC07|nr:ABC transporter ATP-binding protein [Brevibacillus choshinensis]
MFVVTAVTVVYPLILKYTIDVVFTQQQFGLVPYLAMSFVGQLPVQSVGNVECT